MTAAARSSAPEGACCCICLSSVESLQLLSCMSCVCEGVFHKDCLERVPRTEGGGLLRRCPNCRVPGRKILVKEVLDAYLGARGLDEAEAGPSEATRLRRHLRARTQQLQKLTRGSELASGLLFATLPRAPFRFLSRRAPEGLRCAFCRGLLETFRDVCLLDCSCSALAHASCIEAARKKVVDGGRSGGEKASASLLLCDRCQDPLPEPAAVCVKSITLAFSRSPAAFRAAHLSAASRRVSRSLRAVSRAICKAKGLEQGAVGEGGRGVR